MNTMHMPGFTAEDSLYKTSGHYQAGRHAINSPYLITPAIPMCRNCDYILDQCEIHGGRPRAVCNACARGYCYEEQPGTGDPAIESGICPPGGYNPDYDPEICKECVEICDTTYPIEPCEGSKTWCDAINAEALRKRRDCYLGTCGWRFAVCA